MSETETIIQEYIDGLILDLNEGYKQVTIAGILRALREIQDTARKECRIK